MNVGSSLAPMLALALSLTAYGLAREPAPSAAALRQDASAYRFQRFELPAAAPALWTHEPRSIRPVNRRLLNIRSWISAVGAAVTIGDLTGQGIPRDVCWVDPRTDSLIVGPLPGDPHPYTPFVLRPPAHPGLDPASVAPMGCLIGDFNEDGVPDILAYYWGRSPVIFFASGAAGKLRADQFQPRELVPSVPRWYTNAVLATNLTGQSHADLIIGNYFQDGAKILDTAATDPCDMQSSMSRGRNGAGLHAFRWTRAGYIEQQDAFDAGTAGWTLAIASAPINGDKLPDVYVANDFGPDHLLRNTSSATRIRFEVARGTRYINTPRSSVLGDDSFKGMGADFADLLHRGRFDLFVSNITTPYALEESNFAFINTGDEQSLSKDIAPFENRAEAMGLARSGWAWDVKVGDFDNSGRPAIVQAVGFLHGEINRWPELQELATGNDEMLCDARDWPNFDDRADLSGGEKLKFYVTPKLGEQYADVAPLLGLTSDAVGRGIATADTAGDGRLDFAVANQYGASYFYKNVAVVGKALEVRVVLPIAASHRLSLDPERQALRVRAALGATVEATTAMGRIIAAVDASSGHSGHRDSIVHFGLGKHPEKTIPTVIRWTSPSGPHEVTLSLTPGLHTVVLPSI